MEKMKGVDKRDNLIKELLQGIEFAKDLRNHFMKNSTNGSSLLSSSLSDDNQAPNFLLLERLMSTFDKTISMAKLIHFQVNQDPSINYDNNNYGQLESAHSLTMSSPKSENSHPTSKRRRSMMPKWSKKVKISNEGGVTCGVEGTTLDDGFSWRKYGQKDILGSQFPRAYYRCSYRHSRNCAALRQVQRSDEDSTIHQIMYIGEHTCTQGAQLKKAQSNPIIPAQLDSNPQPPPSPQQQVYLGLTPEGDLKVEPENELDDPAQIFLCFSFNQAHQLEPIDDNYMLSFCPTFGSPATLESNCLPMLPYQGTMAHIGLAVQTSGTDFNDAVSGPNSDVNSPVMGGDDFEFSLGELPDIGCDFPFEFDLP